MLFRQELYVGFSYYGSGSRTRMPAHRFKNIDVRARHIDAAGSFAGSYHVIEMGRQYSDYVRYAHHFPNFPAIPGFPTTHQVDQLDVKTRAADITGNIGETLAGIVAHRTLGFDAGRIAHLKVDGRTPDYLLHRTPGFSRILRRYIPALKGRGLPRWWAMESKARSKGFSSTEIKEALRQLVAYWYQIQPIYPQGVGYGIIIISDFSFRRRICIYAFIPNPTSPWWATTRLGQWQPDPTVQNVIVDELESSDAFLR
jgi:hypothetical protein